MTPYYGNMSYRAYEMRLEHMANQYNWGDDEKLKKLVEALQDNALTFYSHLLDNVHENYTPVKKVRSMVWTKISFIDCQKPTKGNSAETRGSARGVFYILQPAHQYIFP